MAAGPNHQTSSVVVFSDDWGRHPSSCQHLFRELLPGHQVLWVNTIGTRPPRLDLATLARLREKAAQWCWPTRAIENAAFEDTRHPNLAVCNPKMWPWFKRRRDRRLNRWLLGRQLGPLIEQYPQPVTAVTTLPITADLPGTLPVRKWVYYCVDDFGEWPGLDGDTLRSMDELMIERADEIITVSEHLRQRIAGRGRHASILTHGVDVDFWRSDTGRSDRFLFPTGTEGPTAVFWGVVDRRLDVDMLTALSQKLKHGTILLFGPHQDPDERLFRLRNVKAPGSLPYSTLPALAAAADVLIMPYADLPVTRAMQPLKLKEYMATGKPVVVSSLPASRSWHQCLDVAETAEEFGSRVLLRMQEPFPSSQNEARQRLRRESWAAKSLVFEESLLPGRSQTSFGPKRKASCATAGVAID